MIAKVGGGVGVGGGCVRSDNCQEILALTCKREREK